MQRYFEKPLKWFKEGLYESDGITVALRVRVLEEYRSRYQEIGMYWHHHLGHILTLDGVVQWFERGEWYYHETIAHWPMYMYHAPRRVLVVGGGDLGVARELRKHFHRDATLEQIDVVDIDPEVRRITLTYTPGIAGEAAYDKRVRKIDADAATFVGECASGQYDVVIMDTTDEIGCAVPLFGEVFLREVHRILSNCGVLVRVAGSGLLQEKEVRNVMGQIARIFHPESTGILSVPVPMYYGTPFILGVGMKQCQFDVSMRHNHRLNDIESSCKYYNAHIHKSVATPTRAERKTFLSFLPPC